MNELSTDGSEQYFCTMHADKCCRNLYAACQFPTCISCLIIPISLKDGACIFFFSLNVGVSLSYIWIKLILSNYPTTASRQMGIQVFFPFFFWLLYQTAGCLQASPSHPHATITQIFFCCRVTVIYILDFASITNGIASL